MRRINTIILHMAATPPEMDIGAETIRDWHVRERGWDDIGYHYVVRRNGEIEPGREPEVIGAHAYGHNEHSIGICLVGGLNAQHQPDCNYTQWQWSALRALVEDLTAALGPLEVIGHRDVSTKACPGFDARRWWHGDD